MIDCLWDEILTSQFYNHDGFSVSKLSAIGCLLSCCFLFRSQTQVKNDKPTLAIRKHKTRAVDSSSLWRHHESAWWLSADPAVVTGRQPKWWLLFLLLPLLHYISTAHKCVLRCLYDPTHILRSTSLDNCKSISLVCYICKPSEVSSTGKKYLSIELRWVLSVSSCANHLHRLQELN